MKKFTLMILILLLIFPITVRASEAEETVSQEEVQESLLQKFDFSEIDDMLVEIFPNKKLNVREVLGSLITGDLELSFELIKQVIVDQFTFEMRNSRSGMIHILLLVIVSTIFTNFSSVFKSTQVAEISFSMLYMFHNQFYA